MLTELCQELRNWFDRNQPKHYGLFEIRNGSLTDDVGLLDGQYFRIIGSVLNDGVYKYPATGLHDESFHGAIWSMAIPPAVIELSARISEWRTKYEASDSAAMSPFSSESFGGYSYVKGSGGVSGTNAEVSWKKTFASELNRWRKL